MIMLAAILAIANSTPTSLPTRDVKDAVVACGIPSENVKVEFQSDLEEDLIQIGPTSNALPESVLTCIAKVSVDADLLTSFASDALQEQFGTIYFRLWSAAAATDAKEWLVARGLSDGLPNPQVGQALSIYTRAVETFCGVAPQTFLTTPTEHFITITEDGLGHLTENGIEDAAVSDDQSACISNVLAAADLNSRDIFFGFYGNAAVESAPVKEMKPD